MKLAKITAKIREQLHAIDDSLLTPKSRKSWKALRMARLKFDALRSELDYDYHSVITDKQFKELGHIYYGGKTKQEMLCTKQQRKESSNTQSGFTETESTL